MNEYEKQANDFLAETETKLEVKESAIQSEPLWVNKGEKYGIKYDVKLENAKGQYVFNFWGSIHNKEQSNEPTAYDVIACLTTNEVGTVWNFINEFGYEANEKTQKIYQAVKAEYKGLKRIFTDEDFEKLAEIN